ncbi:MAG: hypothetical protein CL678_00975 [Bdellovibrionaceae bacterium]|nr:hypothetical protein [Pseudobdellovibrionaceae bacterium]|tara:strand:- start:1179 stop:1961 length:783 start_codon:yes stop_codon:yes gene_type:complete
MIIVRAAEESVANAFPPTKFITFASVFIFLILESVTVLALLARYFIMHHATYIAHHAHAFANMINGPYDFLVITCYLLFDSIEQVVNFIMIIPNLVKGKTPHVKDDFSNLAGIKQHLNPVDANELAASVMSLPVRCASYDGVWPVLQGMVRPVADPVICPVVRFTYPLPWLWSSTNWLLGWMTYGATPPGAPGLCIDCTVQNCNVDSTGMNDTLCITLGTGYILLEIVLPLFFFALTFRVWWPLIKLPFLLVFGGLAEVV